MNKRNVFIASAAALIVVVGAVWFFFLRSDAPPPATIEDAVASVTSTTAGDSGGTTQGPESTVPNRDGLDGSWSADTEVSFVGYRIDEELASIGAITAVGRTNQITADLEFQGSQVTSLDVTVDMTTLESDRSQRDSAMRSRGLETSSFPEAAFSLTTPIGLGAVPAEGETFIDFSGR